MARIVFTVLFLVVAVLVGFYQIQLKPRLKTLGIGRAIESLGNSNCRAVQELQACEKIVLHQPTGLLYLACSTPSSRTHWTPAVSHLNTTGMSHEDYVATYDPETSKITRLQVVGFDSGRDLSLHGMDVVPSSSNPKELFVYLVNHRRPLDGANPGEVGADSSIEVFKTTVGGSTLTHIKTVQDQIIMTPNDVVGSSSGQSFYFSNDHGAKIGVTRMLELLFSRPVDTSVGFCHLDVGCKTAVGRIPGSNGITRSTNDTFYLASFTAPELRVLERQADDSLVVTDLISVDRVIDNLSVDNDGILWAAGFPNTFHTTTKHFPDPSIPSPSSALRICLNMGRDAFFGQKYKVDKVFEDEGSVASGATSVVHDSQRGRLFLHGLCSPHLTICKYSN